jgi:preprotein translocase subunit YajC
MNAILSGLPLLQAAPNATGSLLSTVITFGLVFGIFYFLIIRPQNKKQKETQKMIEAVKKGDKVVTIGGVHGTVHAVEDGAVVVRVDENCRIKFSKSAIAAVTAKGEVVEAAPEGEKK